MRVELHFNRFDEWPAAREALPAAERAARAALEERAGHGRHGEDGGPDEVSFTCLGSGEIAEMNRRYLDREGPTDVIAFPLSGPGSRLTGDVYLCPQVARENAAERELPASEEIVRLVTHGALHVVGHDHPEGEEREASEMYRLQEEVVERALRDAGRGTEGAGEDGAAGSRPGGTP